MPIHEFARHGIRHLPKITFAEVGLKERRDLQRLLRDEIEVIAPETLVIAEEFGDWDGSGRRIDLLAVDQKANLVVIELKRTEDGGHMELQALRYAAMVSTMTFDQAVTAFGRHLSGDGKTETDARDELLEFLGWDEPNEDEFAQNVRIVLASADFSPELTTSVLWLNESGLDIRCVRLQPYDLDGRILVDVQQIIPLPEMAEYQVQVTEKRRKERAAARKPQDRTKFDVTFGDRRRERLPKRQAIFEVVRHLVGNGTSPKEIVQRCTAILERNFVDVDGVVDEDTFRQRLTEAWAEEGRNFEQGRRFFCKGDELLHHGGCTYAFSNQWGYPWWMKAMQDLKDAFPDQEIAFEPSDK